MYTGKTNRDAFPYFSVLKMRKKLLSRTRPVRRFFVGKPFFFCSARPYASVILLTYITYGTRVIRSVNRVKIIRTVISAAVLVQIQPPGSGTTLAALICRTTTKMYVYARVSFIYFNVRSIYDENDYPSRDRNKNRKALSPRV